MNSGSRDVVGSRAKPNVIPPCFSSPTFESHSCDRAWTHVTQHDSRFLFSRPSTNPRISAGRLCSAFLLSTVENFDEAFGGSIVVEAVSVPLAPPGGVCWDCHGKKRLMRGFACVRNVIGCR
uniref:Uncharacterized protein n=1 Tax=Rousettus aegyptiacus TaxID=9407 RepID=A0A7J8GAV8_ROUAE|nr:hypothetical protein HJG63_011595 [Rousettus aegyptiacus]